MNILVWNESYVAGGQCWSLIDLVRHWPDKNDRFKIYINKTHEGYSLIEEKTKGIAEVKPFHSLIEIRKILFKKSKLFSLFPINKIVIVFAMTYFYFKYLNSFTNKDFDVLLMNNGGYPGGLTNFLVSLIAKKNGISQRVMIVRNYPIVHYTKSIIMLLTKMAGNASLTSIVTVSNDLRDSIKQLSGINPALIETIHNGTSMENKTTKNKENNKSIPFVKGQSVGIIGTIQERKGHKILFQAWIRVQKKFPEARLFIMTSSTSGDKVKLESLAEELNISNSLYWVEFVKNIGDVYKNLDIVVMPSQGFESFGRTAIEAMASKKPIIASRVGGVPEIVTHGDDGYLFKKDDPFELADLIDDLLSSEEKRIRLGENGYKKYNAQFTADTMARNYYKKLNVGS